MMEDSLRSSTIIGFFWNAVDKFAAQAAYLIISIVLARLLMPEDFGLISMLSIFFAISQSFISSGMGLGLVQKKNRTDIDFSTVFVFNLTVSVIFYIILFFSAPLIAKFYNVPQLVNLTRVLSISIIISSLAVVQNSRLVINLDFKTLAKANIVAIIASGIIAIYLAYIGWNVWALVVQGILRSTIYVCMLWLLSKWKPSILFSRKSFKELFGFGSKLLIQGLYGTIMQNLYEIIIGKYYSAGDLGYYSKAKGFAETISATVSSILHQVTFPVLASLQDEKERMVSVYRRLIKMTVFFIFPVMTLLALLADPFIRFFLTEKWLPSVVLLQWICFARILRPIGVINMSILNAMGRSDLYLKVDLSKAPIFILILVITVPIGVKAMVIGLVCSSFINFFINAYLPGKLLGYGAFNQLKDMLPVMLATVVMAVIVFISTYFVDEPLLKLMIGGFTGIAVYTLMAFILRLNELNEIKSLIIEKIRK